MVDRRTSLQLLAAGAVEFIAGGHPNKMRFRGVLVRLDEPSDKPPHGSDGHKIMVPVSVAKKRLNTLIGMGLNYSPSLDGHAQRRKVGTITKAWIDGKNLCVEGTVWKKDFPEAERDLKQSGLGMSMEISEVQVHDPRATVWALSDLCFTGATILWKTDAAYYRTQAIAAKADTRKGERSSLMKKTKTSAAARGKVVSIDAQGIAEIAASAAAKSVGSLLTGHLKRQTDIMASMNHTLETLSLRADVSNMEAARREDDEEEDDEEAEGMSVPTLTTKKVKAGKKEDDDEEDDEEEDDEEAAGKGPGNMDDDDEDEDDDEDLEGSGIAPGIDKGTLDNMDDDGGPDPEDPKDLPGNINRTAKNKGSQTQVEDKLGKNLNKAITGASLKAMRDVMRGMLQHLRSMEANQVKMWKQFKRYKKQTIAAGASTGRRTREIAAAGIVVSGEVDGVLKRAGINPIDLKASGTKMSVADVDGILNATGLNLDVVKRAEIKTKLATAGLMDEGAVQR